MAMLLHHIIGLGIGVTVAAVLWGVMAVYWRMTHSDDTTLGF
jgi:hypothetical protein